MISLVLASYSLAWADLAGLPNVLVNAFLGKELDVWCRGGRDWPKFRVEGVGNDVDCVMMPSARTKDTTRTTGQTSFEWSFPVYEFS